LLEDNVGVDREHGALIAALVCTRRPPYLEGALGPPNVLAIFVL
jgi:hypothetical protein